MASLETPPSLSLLTEQELMGIQLSDDPQERARQEADLFLRDTAPRLGRLFGMDLNMRVGEGWSTDLESGDVSVDINFFLDKGYTPEMAVYAILHETAAHLREVVNEPRLTERVIDFVKKGPAESIFHNIFSDIAGNNLIHAMLPKMELVAERTYREKLFPDNLEVQGQPKSYTDLPRHLQFLYKIIRDEMIPGSQTEVLPEVDEVIDSLRQFKGKDGKVAGDLIKYSTAVAKSGREAMRPQERFAIWTNIIYPRFQKLIEQDKQDPVPGSGDSRQGDGQSSGQPGKSQDGQSQPGEKTQKPADGTDGEKDFKPYYDDYFENRHPEPMNEEDHDKLHEYAKKQAEKKRDREKINPTRELDKKIRRETGYSLNQKKQYEEEMLKYLDAIKRMREVFQSVITERVAVKRGLGRQPLTEGAVLDPDRLPQTVVDIKAGISEPEAFRDYERITGRTEAVGKTDYIFVRDCSTSMDGEVPNSAIGTKSDAAAICSLIFLEAMSAMQADIEAAEAEHNLDLELELRTAIYTFGSSFECLKELSPKLGLKERLDVFHAALAGSTADFLALEEIARLPKEPDRRRIIIVMSDGGSDDDERAVKAIKVLRNQGCLVYGISIGDDAAERLYTPDSRRVDNPDELPEAMEKLIEDTIT